MGKIRQGINPIGITSRKPTDERIGVERMKWLRTKYKLINLEKVDAIEIIGVENSDGTEYRIWAGDFFLKSGTFIEVACLLTDINEFLEDDRKTTFHLTDKNGKRL